MKYRFLTADVFTDTVFGGNPLAVLPDAAGLLPDRMQQIAREFNLSETAFVLPPDDERHTCKLRIFTPKTELPFAGHPTVGTAFVLASIGRVALEGEATEIVLEEGVGPVNVSIRSEDGVPISARLTAAQPPEKGPSPPDIEGLVAALSIEPGDILSDEEDRPEAWSAGVPFLCVPVRDLAALSRVAPDSAAWRRTLADFWAPHVYVFVRDPEADSIRARMFAPSLVAEEDPATGAAATAFAGYIAAREGETGDTVNRIIEQGVEMGRPSRLEVEVVVGETGAEEVRVGGASVLVSDGQIDVP